MLVAGAASAMLAGQACGGGDKGSAPKVDASVDGSGSDGTDASPGDGATGVNAADAGSASAGDALSDAPAEAGVLKPWDLTGVVGTGQSLSVGVGGNVASARQPYHNLKLSLGTAMVPPFDPNSGALSLVPLTEPIHSYAQTYPSAYPLNISGETPHFAMANTITSLFQGAADGGDYATVHTVVGESGQPMSVIDKGAVEIVDGGTSQGRAYAATLFEAQAIKNLAGASGKTYGIGAIVITHGEADTGSGTYERDLAKLWSDYNQDLKAITGQSASIPMLVSQQHSVPSNMGATSASTLAEWHVGVTHPGDIVCSGPKYQYPYYTDGVHLVTAGYDALGEKYAEVFFEKVVLGHDWQPLEPTTVERAGAVITVHFHVPNPPLAWDDTLPSPHQTGYTQWANGRGFEVTAGSGPIPITSVQIVNDTVQITCGMDVSSIPLTVGYAFTTDGARAMGDSGVAVGTFRWGQLRDSDLFTGAVTHSVQPNYCVAFTMPVP